MMTCLCAHTNVIFALFKISNPYNTLVSAQVVHPSPYIIFMYIPW